ncbi:hypothetical protein, partial [Actinocorallia lasiicapitis]
ALTSIQEAVAAYQDLAQTSPAAYLPNLATSLNNYAERLVGSGRSSDVDSALRAVASGMGAGAEAECLLVLARRKIDQGDQAGSLAVLDLAVRRSDEEPDSTSRGRARRAVHAVISGGDGTMTPDPAWPSWATRLLTDLEVERLNRWLATPDWATQAAFLRAEHADLSSMEGRAGLDAARARYPDSAGLQRLADLLDAINADGLETVLEAVSTAQARADLVQRWITAKNWTESRAYLRAHRDALRQPEVAEYLGRLDSPAAAQHRAILSLLAKLDLDEIFDAITDLTVAADHAHQFLEKGNLDLLAVLRDAAPALTSDAFLAPFLASVAAVLAASDDGASDPEAWMRAAGEAATDTQRGAGIARLRRLARRNPGRAQALNELIGVLETPAAGEPKR